MSTLLEYYELVYSTGELFENRIAAACMVAAVNVLNEATDVTDHERRVAWAISALLDARTMARKIKPVVLLNPSIAAAGNAAPDGDIQYVVNGAINYFLP